MECCFKGPDRQLRPELLLDLQSALKLKGLNIEFPENEHVQILATSTALNYSIRIRIAFPGRGDRPGQYQEFRGYVEYSIGLVLTPMPVTSLCGTRVSAEHPERQASSNLRRCIHSIVSPLEKEAL
jgi:hypothetical protein